MSLTNNALCLSQTCSWWSRGAAGGLTVSVRPWHWLTLAAGPYVGHRYRPIEPLPAPDPNAPVVVPLRREQWVGVSGSATFYW